MTKFMTLWKIDTTRIPEDSGERTERDSHLLNLVKEEIKKGVILDWGMFASGDVIEGYTICEGAEQDIIWENLKYAPYIKFRTYPILSISHVEGILTKSIG
jgi:hypothetical protein